MRKRLRMLVLPVLALSLVGFTGCATSGSGNRTEGRRDYDESITDHVQEALENSPVYKFKDVHVSTYDGIVQLSGWANTREEKNAAGTLAGRVNGVAKVVNDISLAPGNQSGQAAASSTSAVASNKSSSATTRKSIQRHR